MSLLYNKYFRVQSLLDRCWVADIFFTDGASSAIIAKELELHHQGFANMLFIAHLLSTVLTGIDLPHFTGLTEVAFIRGHLAAGFAFVGCHDRLLSLPGLQAIVLASS